MKVAILGMGPSADAYARHAAGAGDVRKSFDETWTVNAFGSVFRADRIFHMDDIRIQQIRADAGNAQIAGLLAYLQRAPGPIYTSRPLPEAPNPLLEQTEAQLAAVNGDETKRAELEGILRWLKAERALQETGGFKGLVEYPLAEVINKAGGPPYFTNTVPYAIAYALALGVKSIALFGVDYSYTNHGKAERGRACCEFWLGRAMERGIEVHLPVDTWLMDCNRKDRLYGYDTMSAAFAADDNGACRVAFKDKPAPTAEAIEAVYAH